VHIPAGRHIRIVRRLASRYEFCSRFKLIPVIARWDMHMHANVQRAPIAGYLRVSYDRPEIVHVNMTALTRG
jgi:hypothetical protein